MFKEFARGKYPCELVKKYGMKINLLNDYFYNYHICVKRKAEFMLEIRERVEGENDPALKREGNMIIRRLNAKPLEWWWAKKTVRDAMKGVVF